MQYEEIWRYLISMSLTLHLAAAPHDGENVNMAIEACSRQHSRVPGAPLDVETPLTAGRQLIQNLDIINIIVI